MTQDKPLRTLASEKLHGQGANPSQLGDPISLKAETVDSAPHQQDKGEEAGTSGKQANVMPNSTRGAPESSGGSHEVKMLKGGKRLRGMVGSGEDTEWNQEENSNMSNEGDPAPARKEEGGGSKSKL